MDSNEFFDSLEDEDTVYENQEPLHSHPTFSTHELPSQPSQLIQKWRHVRRNLGDYIKLFEVYDDDMNDDDDNSSSRPLSTATSSSSSSSSSSTSTLSQKNQSRPMRPFRPNGISADAQTVNVLNSHVIALQPFVQRLTDAHINNDPVKSAIAAICNLSQQSTPQNVEKMNTTIQFFRTQRTHTSVDRISVQDSLRIALNQQQSDASSHTLPFLAFQNGYSGRSAEPPPSRLVLASHKLTNQQSNVWMIRIPVYISDTSGSILASIDAHRVCTIKDTPMISSTPLVMYAPFTQYLNRITTEIDRDPNDVKARMSIHHLLIASGRRNTFDWNSQTTWERYTVDSSIPLTWLIRSENTSLLLDHQRVRQLLLNAYTTNMERCSMKNFEKWTPTPTYNEVVRALALQSSAVLHTDVNDMSLIVPYVPNPTVSRHVVFRQLDTMTSCTMDVPPMIDTVKSNSVPFRVTMKEHFEKHLHEFFTSPATLSYEAHVQQIQDAWKLLHRQIRSVSSSLTTNKNGALHHHPFQSVIGADETYFDTWLKDRNFFYEGNRGTRADYLFGLMVAIYHVVFIESPPPKVDEDESDKILFERYFNVTYKVDKSHNTISARLRQLFKPMVCIFFLKVCVSILKTVEDDNRTQRLVSAVTCLQLDKTLRHAFYISRDIFEKFAKQKVMAPHMEFTPSVQLNCRRQLWDVSELYVKNVHDHTVVAGGFDATEIYVHTSAKEFQKESRVVKKHFIDSYSAVHDAIVLNTPHAKAPCSILFMDVSSVTHPRNTVIQPLLEMDVRRTDRYDINPFLMVHDTLSKYESSLIHPRLPELQMVWNAFKNVNLTRRHENEPTTGNAILQEMRQCVINDCHLILKQKDRFFTRTTFPKTRAFMETGKIRMFVPEDSPILEEMSFILKKNKIGTRGLFSRMTEDTSQSTNVVVIALELLYLIFVSWSDYVKQYHNGEGTEFYTICSNIQRKTSPYSPQREEYKPFTSLIKQRITTSTDLNVYGMTFPIVWGFGLRPNTTFNDTHFIVPILIKPVVGLTSRSTPNDVAFVCQALFKYNTTHRNMQEFLGYMMSSKYVVLAINTHLSIELDLRQDNMRRALSTPNNPWIASSAWIAEQIIASFDELIQDPLLFVEEMARHITNTYAFRTSAFAAADATYAAAAFSRVCIGGKHENGVRFLKPEIMHAIQTLKIETVMCEQIPCVIRPTTDPSTYSISFVASQPTTHAAPAVSTMKLTFGRASTLPSSSSSSSSSVYHEIPSTKPSNSALGQSTKSSKQPHRYADVKNLPANGGF
jgi:hypothetical protein